MFLKKIIFLLLITELKLDLWMNYYCIGKKDVKFIYKYYYTSKLDTVTKKSELIKTLTKVEGDYVEFDVF